MSRVRDRLAPILAGALVLIVALSVLLLLRTAAENGTKALTEAKVAQVKAIANSLNARVNAQLSAVAGLGGTPWQLTPGSKPDQAMLRTFDLNPDADSGFFLIDARDTITGGILLRPGKLGAPFAPPGWEQTKSQLATKAAVVLPVHSTGFTTDLPSYDFVVAIRDAATKSVRGALVFEQALTATSPFQQEIAQLATPGASSAAWFFVDSGNSIVATTANTGLGQPVEDRRYVTAPVGLAYIGQRLVVSADVPVLGWRVVFREDRSQFESPLYGPLQKAGLVLVLLLFAVGLALVVMLVRRLREAREQERRLRSLNRAQTEFISVVSHELRTPVAGVLGFLQTTVDHWGTLSEEERRAAVGRALTNARRLQVMTRHVLDIDSIESGELGYCFQRVDLGAELCAAVEDSEAVDATHRVTFAAPPSTLVVDADPDRLQQVLSNLLENARKNSPTTEPILVETEVVEGSDPRVRVSVIDQGPGVAAESVERIFDKFVRSSDNAVTGTGLGLYIARKIVEGHRGRIWCESSPGSRTSFTFELPIAPSGTEEVELGSAEPKIPTTLRA